MLFDIFFQTSKLAETFFFSNFVVCILADLTSRSVYIYSVILLGRANTLAGPVSETTLSFIYKSRRLVSAVGCP